MKRILLILIFNILFFSCKNDIEVVNKLTSQDNQPDLLARNIEIIYSDSGYVKIKTFAPLLEDYSSTKEKNYTIFNKGIQSIFYNSQHKVTSELTANYGKYIKDQNLWELKQNVILKNVNGEILRTEHLFFDEDKEILYTQKFVEIKLTDGSKVSGKGGFESNFGFTKYKFIDVSGKYNFNKN